MKEKNTINYKNTQISRDTLANRINSGDIETLDFADVWVVWVTLSETQQNAILSRLRESTCLRF